MENEWSIRPWLPSVTGGKSTRKKSTQNKKVHLNKFVWTISVGFHDSCHREEGKHSREFFEKVRVNAVFFGISGFRWVFEPLKWICEWTRRAFLLQKKSQWMKRRSMKHSPVNAEKWMVATKPWRIPRVRQKGGFITCPCSGASPSQASHRHDAAVALLRRLQIYAAVTFPPLHQDPDSTPTTNICRFSIWFWVGEVNPY